MKFPAALLLLLLVLPIGSATAADPASTAPSTTESSGLTIDRLTRKQGEALWLLGKVWGFVKYHHPGVANGTQDIDRALLSAIPAVLQASSDREMQRAILAWVDSLGDIPTCQDCVSLERQDLQLAPSLGWLSDTKRLGPTLSRRLQSIYQNRPANLQRFVTLAPQVGNSVFDREAPYADIRFPDSGYQVLAIFRFWNAVEYWFPYRDLIDEKWDDVLLETLRTAAIAQDKERFRDELIRLVARVDDGHAMIRLTLQLRKPEGECQLPVNLRFVEDRYIVFRHLVPDAAATSLAVGDAIISIGQVPLADIARNVRPFYGASNEATRMRDIARSITHGPCGDVAVNIQRDRDLIVDAKRVPFASLKIPDIIRNDRAGEAFQILSDDAAYLKLSNVKSKDIPEYIAKAASTRFLIVDVRGYPADFVVYSLGGSLVEGPTPFARFTLPELSNPGAFRWANTAVLEPQSPHYGGRIGILVDESTFSQSEFTAMALRASPRAKVFGSTTAGADGNVSTIPLPGGFIASMTGIGVFYPDRRGTQQSGIVPDTECKATIAGIRAGRDEVLECALQAMRSSSAGAH